MKGLETAYERILFRRGTDGYREYRMPGIVIAADGAYY